jgi:hypothetical protein
VLPARDVAMTVGRHDNRKQGKKKKEKTFFNKEE